MLLRPINTNRDLYLKVSNTRILNVYETGYFLFAGNQMVKHGMFVCVSVAAKFMLPIHDHLL